ncbi:MAG: hypothetical protein WC915_01490 [archaeon]|jgi:hypothetical protein
MSLADPYEEYEELVGKPSKRGQAKNKLQSILLKSRFILIIFIVGLICGILFGHTFIEPLLAQESSNTCKTCVASKELLSKEINCLYTLLDNPTEQINTCNNLDK